VAATDSLCRSFLDLWWHFDPAPATAARLGDFDAESIRQHAAALRSIAAALEELEIDDVAEEIDRTALLDHLRVLLFRLQHEHPYQRNPLLWIEHLAVAFASPLAQPPGNDVAAASALERMRALPKFSRTAQDALRLPPQILLDAALDMLPHVVALVSDCEARFRDVWENGRPRETGEGEGAVRSGDHSRIVDEAKAALRALEAALRSEILPDPDPHAGAIGEAEADRRLHHEHASIHNAAEVWRGALRLATEVEAEVTALAALVDSGRPWREVYAASANGPLSEPQMRVRFAESLAAARTFSAGKGIGGPDFTPIEVEALSGPELVLEAVVAYHAAGRRPAAVRLGAITPAAMPWLAARIGVPGLHLIETRTDQLPGEVRRHIAASSTPAGWALFAEELMIELGYEPDPESRLIERVLFLREMHLALVDIGLHTRQLTAEEAVAHLATRIPLDRRIALADVRRLLSRPLSACAAMLGWQELRRLREDYARSRSTFALPGFLEELFSYGGLPVPLIRWGMGIET